MEPKFGGGDASANAQRFSVFVYGTLKRGFKNYVQCLQGPIDRGSAEFIERATTEEMWPMFVDAYGIPYVPNFPGEGRRISGEIFDVDRENPGSARSLGRSS